MVYPHSGSFRHGKEYSTIHTTTWVNLGDVTPSGRSQMQKATYHMTPTYVQQPNQVDPQRQVDRARVGGGGASGGVC